MTIKEIRQLSGLSQVAFSEKYKIPRRSIENWEGGKRQCPDYVATLLERAVKDDIKEALTMSNFEAKKKIVEAGESKIFQNWHEYAGIEKEDFIKELEWLCSDPLDERGKMTRELGCKATQRLEGNKIIWNKDGKVYHLKRVYNFKGTDSESVSFYYDDERAGKLNHTLYGMNGLPSISAQDRI